MGRGASSTNQAVATRPRSRSSVLAPVDAATELTADIADSSLSSPDRTDPFAAVFGAQRGEGDTRLDTSQPAAAARTRLTRALDHARAGNLDPACVFLSEHRRSVDAPMVAELMASLTDAACSREFKARQEWLAEFMHSTVRDGRDGRILRAQKTLPSRGEPAVFDLHLRPDAEVDDATFRLGGKNGSRVIAACGSTSEDTLTGLFQRADVGVWSENCDARYVYHRCPECMSLAPQVPETSAAHAGVLPEADLALLHHAHREAVSAKIRGGLRRRAGLSSERLASYAQKSFPAAAVAAGTQYALSGGDERLKKYCSFTSSAEYVARENGYTGPVLDLLDTEFFTAALQARMPRQPPKPTAWANGPVRRGRDTWATRRKRFESAISDELLQRAHQLSPT